MNPVALLANELSSRGMERAPRWRQRALSAAVLVIVAGSAAAGDLDAPGGPSTGESALYSLEDLYKRLADGSEGQKRIGGFAEPATGPASTMYTLNQIMAIMPAVNPAGATATQVLTGQTFWGLRTDGWGLLTGTMPNVGQQTITPGTTAQTITQGYHDGTGQVAGDGDLAAGNIKAGVTIFDVPGSAIVATGTAAAGDVLTGKTFSNASGTNLSGTMTNVGQQVISPGTTAQPITQGYHNGTGQVAGDSDLVAANIKAGVSVFGVVGTYTGATPSVPFPVPKTGAGAIAGYELDPHEDGALQKGVSWPSPRMTCNPNGICDDLFGDNDNGTVTDNLTGLVWLKNANCTETVGGVSKPADGRVPWATAMAWVAALANGSCGLTDGSVAGQWRLPNIKELSSLVDAGASGPALPGGGAPFTRVENYYWASTNFVYPSGAWVVSLSNGTVTYGGKTVNFHAWPVRGG